MKNEKQSINFVFKIIFENKWIFLFTIFISLLWASCISLQSYMIKKIIDVLGSSPKELIFSNLKFILIAYFSFLFFMTFILRIQEYFFNSINMPRIRKNIIDLLFTRVIKYSHNFFQNNVPAEISDKIRDIAESTISLFKTIFDGIVYYLFTAIVSLLILFKIFPICGFLISIWILFFAFIVKIYMKNIVNSSKDFANNSSFIVGKIMDVFSNIISVRLFFQHDYENKKLYKTTDVLLNSEKKMEFEYTKIWSFYTISFFIIQIFLIYFILNGFKEGKIVIGDVALIWGINVSLVNMIWKFARDFADIQRYYGKINNGLCTLLKDEIIFNENNLKNLTLSSGEIKFENISFTYFNEKKIFNNFSLTIKGGEKVGLVGFSGSGKTTFVNLILKLFKVQSGRILIDNQDINEISEKSLRDKITLVPQNPILFDRSINENILYGKLNCTDEEFKKSIKNSEADKFIYELKDKDETIVGENGFKLSGGQRQRIIMARAFLKNSSILILDEATSSLDSKTEKLIRESLDKLMENKTVIAVAHRLSTLLNMDRIIVFDEGKIIQDGTHQDLIKKNGLYKELWNAQNNLLDQENDEI